jgi:polysaccharide biosynthesis/export protein
MDTSSVKRCFVVLILLVGSVCAGCSAAIPDYNYAKEPDPRNAEYIIGIGDRLEINVWENEPLSTSAVVRPDGTITMPLVGDLKAAGDTPSALKTRIKSRLADFIKLGSSAEITVAIGEANSYRFTIAGEVSRQGVYTSAYYVTVLEALTLAGGFTRFADSDHITLQRRDPKTGKLRTIPLVYDVLVKGERPDMNIVVLAGDAIFVP